MSPFTVLLAEGFYPQDVRPWYDRAKVGDIITIALSSRETTVRLMRRSDNHVRWWPEGGRGMTMTLEDAILRLEMLRESRLHPGNNTQAGPEW